MASRSVLGRVALVATSISIGAGLLLARLPILSTRRFDPDELEHVHVAWYIHLGQVPYRDFFEHHTPLFHYLLAAFLSRADVSRSTDAAMHALFAARHVTWGLSVGIVLLTCLLARRLRDSLTAWVTLPIAAGSIVLALRAVEIRPDGLSTLLWLISLISLHEGLRAPGPRASAARWWFGASGLAIGLAVLTSQKLLLAGPAVALLLTWYVARAEFGGSLPARASTSGCYALGVMVPWGLALGYFAQHEAAAAFVRFTLFDNLRWKSETTAATILRFITRYEPWLLALAAGGVAWLAREARRDRDRLVPNIVLMVAAVGVFLGLFVVPVPYAQYCLTFTPLFAILAASFLVESARALASRPSLFPIRSSDWPALSVLTLVALLWAAGLWIAQPLVVLPVVYPAMVAGALVVTFALPWHRQVDIALAATICALALVSFQWTAWMRALGDDGQFAEMRYVLDHTRPEDVVLDGWSGNGALRRHANYYWMFHPGVRAMLSPTDVGKLLDDLSSGRVQPAAVVLDDNLRALSPLLVRFVESRYRASGVGAIFVLKP